MDNKKWLKNLQDNEEEKVSQKENKGKRKQNK